MDGIYIELDGGKKKASLNFSIYKLKISNWNRKKKIGKTNIGRQIFGVSISSLWNPVKRGEKNGAKKSLEEITTENSSNMMGSNNNID